METNSTNEAIGEQTTVCIAASNTQTVSRYTVQNWPFAVKLRGQRNLRTSQGYSHSLTPGLNLLTTNLGLQGLVLVAGVEGLEMSIWYINMWDLELVIQVTYFSAGTVFFQDDRCISQDSLGVVRNQAIVALIRKGPRALQGYGGIHEIIGRAQ